MVRSKSQSGSEGEGEISQRSKQSNQLLEQDMTMPEVRVFYLRDGYARNNGDLDGWYRNLTVKEAKDLNYGSVVAFIDKNGQVRTARVQGKPKTWKRSPGVEITLKYGLREYCSFGSKHWTEYDGIPRLVVRLKKEFPPECPAGVVQDYVVEHET